MIALYWKLNSWLYRALKVDRLHMQLWLCKKYHIRPYMTYKYYHGLIAEKGIVGRLLFKKWGVL